MSSSAPVISVVVPLFQEETRLHRLLDELGSRLAEIGEPYEIVLIDDGSSDKTWEVVEAAAAKNPVIVGRRLSRNFGKEAALCAGLEVARGEATIVMDGDLQHPPALIPDMVKRWRDTDCDVVEAVKTGHKRDAAAGRFFGRFFYWSMKKFSGIDLKHASDFKLITRRVLDAWLRLGERGLFFRGMIAWLGFRREQIEFEVPGEHARKSRWSTRRLFELGTTGITAFSSAPLRAASLLGVVFFLFAVILGAHSLWMKFSGKAVEGFTTVIILQLLIGSMIAMLLGVIGEYLARIYEEVKGRPRFLIADETNAASRSATTDESSAGESSADDASS